MHMWCLDGIGREIWDREGQESVVRPDFNSPQDLGEEALTEWTRLTVETERPRDIVLVVVVVVDVVVAVVVIAVVIVVVAVVNSSSSSSSSRE